MSIMASKVPLLLIFIVASVTGNTFDGTIAETALSILKSSYVHMKNESEVFEKINAIVSQGAEKLQFITDFDRTITKQYVNNTKTLRAFDVFYRSKQLPQSSLNLIFAALKKFETAEFDSTVGAEGHKRLAYELTKTFHEQMQGHEFDRQEIKEVVRKYGPPFRDRSKELFSRLKHLDIPVVVFSAGLGDIIKEQFDQENIEYDNVTFIANYLQFNGTMLNGLQNHENLVDLFNKHEHLSRHMKSETLKNRKNIILMGDHMEDAAIIREHENDGTILKIGFFHAQAGGNLEIFKETFDIVLNDDETMNVILDIIKLLE